MSRKLPSFTCQEVLKKLKKAGFIESRQRGSHLRLVKYDEKRMVTLPIHFKKDIPKGTLLVIIKQAGLTIEEFLSL
ncbi:MAG: type II toxin-antitoxin system HicA family toxin [Ignavibacteriae bacterium]|nr:type II toxin-antitoxin system HicA family toxin [Ignavibacteriota bacterium]